MLTEVAGLVLKTIREYSDSRGSFSPVINSNDILEMGLYWQHLEIEQTNIVHNKPFVIRGMHLQKSPSQQAKVISVISGAIRDVVIDLRKNSDTFGREYFFDLTSKNHQQLWVPTGFAHGYEVLQHETTVIYTILGGKYDPSSEICITPHSVGCWTSVSFDKFTICDRDKYGLALADVKNQIESGQLDI
jgi:dTDP-4-dehydrorhamnose 3,5-epimerase